MLGLTHGQDVGRIRGGGGEGSEWEEEEQEMSEAGSFIETDSPGLPVACGREVPDACSPDSGLRAGSELC